jgi:hypothetical protein
MDIALCKCGVDMSEHDNIEDHEFDAAGTRHRCGLLVPVYPQGERFACARPAYHDEENVPCGGLTGRKLW